MKTAKWVLLAGMVVMLMTMGCDKMMTSVVPQPDGDVRSADLPPMGTVYNYLGGSWFLYFNCTPSDVPPPQEFFISIGQDNGATGSIVKIWKDADSVYAEFHTTGNWYIVQAHFDVATSPYGDDWPENDWPKNKEGLTHNKAGNLMPGKFAGQTNNDEPYPQVTKVSVPWNADWNGKELAMAALCYVCQGEIRYDGEVPYWYYWNFNTGCGGTTEAKILRLPTFPVSMSCYKLNVPRSYWKVTLSGIGGPGAGYNVWDGDWAGWCFDLWNNGPKEDTTVQVILRSVFDPNLPAHYLTNYSNDKPIYWDRIAWLINEYSGNNWKYWSDLYPDYVTDMMWTIYYLSGWADKPNWEPAQTWATNADTYGPGWEPYAGAWVPVICEYVPYWKKFQLLFIEVDP